MVPLMTMRVRTKSVATPAMANGMGFPHMGALVRMPRQNNTLSTCNHIGPIEGTFPYGPGTRTTKHSRAIHTLAMSILLRVCISRQIAQHLKHKAAQRDTAQAQSHGHSLTYNVCVNVHGSHAHTMAHPHSITTMNCLRATHAHTTHDAPNANAT